MRKSAPLFCALLLSLSARRAWIEIILEEQIEQESTVALRKESVDRNVGFCLGAKADSVVALRKESVDRNNPLKTLVILPKRRSPQGERG